MDTKTLIVSFIFQIRTVPITKQQLANCIATDFCGVEGGVEILC
jgi:hypothetical protein